MHGWQEEDGGRGGQDCVLLKQGGGGWWGHCFQPKKGKTLVVFAIAPKILCNIFSGLSVQIWRGGGGHGGDSCVIPNVF